MNIAKDFDIAVYTNTSLTCKINTTSDTNTTSATTIMPWFYEGELVNCDITQLLTDKQIIFLNMTLRNTILRSFLNIAYSRTDLSGVSIYSDQITIVDEINSVNISIWDYSSSYLLNVISNYEFEA